MTSHFSRKKIAFFDDAIGLSADEETIGYAGRMSVSVAVSV